MHHGMACIDTEQEHKSERNVLQLLKYIYSSAFQQYNPPGQTMKKVQPIFGNKVNM